MPGRLRAADRVAIVLLMGAWAAVLAAGIADGLRTGNARVPLAVSSAAGPAAYPTVNRVLVGGREPFEPGDELRSVAGEDLAGATALWFLDRATRAAREGGFALVQGVRAGAPFEARLELQRAPIWWLSFLFPIALMLTALGAWIAAPGWHLSRRYFLACWCFAMTARSAIWPPASIFEGWLTIVLMPLGTGLTIWNAAEITLSARPVPWMLRGVAVAGAGLSLAFLLVLRVLPHPRVVADALRLAWTLTLMGGTLAGLTRAYLRSDPLERRQLRWILLGFYVSMAGFTLSALSASSVLSSDSSAYSFVYRLAGLGIPIGIAVSVFGYRYLDVDPVISAVASYTVVGLAVIGGALALVPRVVGATAPALGIDAAAGQWVLTMALLGLAIPVHRFLRPRIDRRLFAARHERTLGFERLLDELGRCTSVEELTRLPGERMDAMLEPESLAIYAREESLFTPIFVRGGHTPPAFETSSLLVRTLERRVRPLTAHATALDPFDRAALETLGVSVVIPTRRGETVVAFTCLGRKRSGDIYTPEEIAYMTAVANRCSEVLAKLDDDVVIREARALQHSLRRYVPGAVAEEIAGGRELAAEEREVSVMFVDIRGYTSLAEPRAAEEVFSTLNAYTETVSRLVRERGGAIVEFHGDGMMAVFGAPRALEAKERAAVEAARDVLGALAGQLPVGIGIATGPAFVGNLRAADRLIWSAVGNTTNLAARLQTLTRELGAAIAIDTATEAGAGYVCADFERHDELAIRGRSERLDVWALPLERAARRSERG